MKSVSKFMVLIGATVIACSVVGYLLFWFGISDSGLLLSPESVLLNPIVLVISIILLAMGLGFKDRSIKS